VGIINARVSAFRNVRREFVVDSLTRRTDLSLAAAGSKFADPCLTISRRFPRPSRNAKCGIKASRACCIARKTPASPAQISATRSRHYGAGGRGEGGGWGGRRGPRTRGRVKLNPRASNRKTSIYPRRRLSEEFQREPASLAGDTAGQGGNSRKYSHAVFYDLAMIRRLLK